MTTGFTLLETLIALAILSIASLAMFQSIGTLLQVSDKAVSASERTVDKSLDRLALITLMSEIVPHWNDQADMAFTGTDVEMSGVSTINLGVDSSGLTPFTLRLVDERGLDMSAWTVFFGIYGRLLHRYLRVFLINPALKSARYYPMRFIY